MIFLCHKIFIFGKPIQMSNPSNSTWNPVMEIYRGVPIKKYPLIRINVSQTEMKKIIDMRLDEGLSARDIVENGRLLCPCKDLLVKKSMYAQGH